MPAALVPELCCSDLDRTLRFYTEILGFSVRSARPEDRFARLEREGAEIIVEEPMGPARLSSSLTGAASAFRSK